MAIECQEASYFPSCNIYEEFNQKNYDSNLSEECLQLKTSLRDYNGIENLCSELEKNLKILCTKVKTDSFINYHVGYLYYWLMDKVLNSFDITNNARFIAVNRRFHNTWNRIITTLTHEHPECKQLERSHSALSMDKLKNMKEIYTYYYNYKYIEMNKISDENKCSAFCKYLSSMSAKFSNLKSWCAYSSSRCSVHKESFEKCYPLNLRIISGCNKNELCTKSSDLDNAQRVEGGNITSVVEKQVDVIPGGSVNPQRDLETSNTVITLAPIGSWFYNGIIKKGKITEHLVEGENNEFSDDYFISDNIKSQGKGYSLTYQSLQNIG
ncbi:PIR Superfamily Protein [Plasmodium ovale curtisi]|uniref:PIR Superfamily Protein n=1 Tax=Plasmodium ovale curtisi TaxID=864141 RepID=A0A1A8XBT4_PLAOA|nr:PIR Superfamily Protein [Plasmodium ovale curtisi]